MTNNMNLMNKENHNSLLSTLAERLAFDTRVQVNNYLVYAEVELRSAK